MNKDKLHLTDLEKEVVSYFFRKNNIDREFFGKEFELLNVVKRDMTGVGFYTDIRTNKSLKEAEIKYSRWGAIGARLNNSIDISFVVYVDNYILHCIEGFTYGTTAWPETITSFKMHELNDNKS